MNKSKQNNQILTEQNLNDIEAALLRKIIRSTEDVDLKINYSDNKHYTNATVAWTNGKGLHTKSGNARKRKGDKYNRRTGQLLALIDMM